MSIRKSNNSDHSRSASRIRSRSTVKKRSLHESPLRFENMDQIQNIQSFSNGEQDATTLNQFHFFSPLGQDLDQDKPSEMGMNYNLGG